ncbi:hypothetical protein K1719_042768 [Acacia pycnantha]|nr:hypothetical protein K1719_042768 [Acacia pycnantha]
MDARTRDFDYEEFYSLYLHNQQIDHFSVERFPLSRLLQLYDYSTVVGTCDGLVCITDYQILIWNPSIRKYMVLPEPILTYSTVNGQHEGYQLFGFGFDSKNKDYKVIRFVTLLVKKMFLKLRFSLLHLVLGEAYLLVLLHFSSPGIFGIYLRCF